MIETKEKKTLLSKLVNQLESIVPYAEAIYKESQTNSLSKDKTGIEPIAEADAGVKVRAFDGLQFHEVCVQGWQPQTLQAEVQALVARLKAKPVSGKTVALKVDREMMEKDFATTPQIIPSSVSMKEKAERITAIHDEIMKFSSDFVNCRVTYREEHEQKIYVNRYKKLSSEWTGCSLAIVPFVQTPDGQTRYDYYSKFSHGFEVTHLSPEKIQALCKRALKVKAAGRIPPGNYTAVLSPNVAGLLAHESFGHGMESDMILRGRAKAEEFLGKKIAPAKVNICDDASIPNTHGHMFFDDEGVLPQRTFMVKAGIVGSPLTESYSAGKKGFIRTANGRAESFDRKIYARMTNTFFLSGKDDPAKMIKDVRNGFYLHHGTSGMEDPKGWGVQVAGVLAERIKNGKLTGEFFYEVSITGYLPKILNNITAVGKDFNITDDVGFCGKGHKEYVRVTSGGPHLAIKEIDLS